jgi:ribosomal-protein-alanine N-acetyltransferase
MSAAAEATAVRLVPGEAADLDGVMEVMATAFDPQFGEGWTRSQCAGILPLSGVRLMLAEDEQGATHGFSLLRTVADEAELLLLAVAPAAQRQGVGGSLLEHFIELGRREGVRRLHLEVRDGNSAVAMYQRFGFKEEGRRPKYYMGQDGSQHDALTMARELL